jgi:hypothetical protein
LVAVSRYAPGTQAAVGDAVGALVGDAVGALVGDEVGALVGSVVGVEVGALVGVVVGDSVGALVGALVGKGVGTAVGLATHTVWPGRPFVQESSAQSSHQWYTLAFWNLPEGQWSQLVWPEIMAKSPAAQTVHSAPVEAWYCPMGQSVHSVAWMLEKRPFAHLSHASTFWSELNLPTGHAMHSASS